MRFMAFARRAAPLALALGGVVAGGAAAQSVAPARQSLDDAWWTGPLLAPSPNTLPQGHVLFEPYVYDVVSVARFDVRGVRRAAPAASDIGSQSYLNYGLADRFTVGVIPRFQFDSTGAGAGSGPGVGDVSLQAQYRLTQFRPGSWIPTTAINLGETLPIGRYDRLDRPGDGIGAGAWTTSLAAYSQTFFWTPNGRLLRTRLNFTYSMSDRVSLQDVSVYGTTTGFRGRASPGDSYVADLAFEYSATRRWVLALDLVLQRDASTTVTGTYPGSGLSGPTPFLSRSGADKEVWLAPAVEYNFSGAVGVIVGARLEPAGRNTTATLTPVAAVNMVY